MTVCVCSCEKTSLRRRVATNQSHACTGQLPPSCRETALQRDRRPIWTQAPRTRLDSKIKRSTAAIHPRMTVAAPALDPQPSGAIISFLFGIKNQK